MLMMASAMCWERMGLPFDSFSAIASVYGSMMTVLPFSFFTRSMSSSRSVDFPEPDSPTTARKPPFVAASYIISRTYRISGER